MRALASGSRRVATLLGALLVCSASAPAAESEASAMARYIVFEVDGDGSVRPQMHRLVRLAEAPRSLTAGELEARLARPFRGDERVRVRMFDADGALAFEDVVAIPKWLRAEGLASDDGAGQGEIDGRLLVSERRSFVVRVPVLESSWLSLAFPRDGGLPPEAAYRDAEFDLDAIAADPTLPLARFEPRLDLRLAVTGSPANRVDLLVMGDGYTAGERAKFDSDAANLVSQFFGISPYNTYKNFFNTATLFTASAQSGADHPPFDAACAPSLFQQCCADTLAQTDPKAGTFVDTAFDSTYCSSNLHRALVLNTTKVLAAAAAAPNWDKVLALVNDATYGGTGGVVAAISTNPQAIGIAQHELGHSLTHLADEYDSAFPSYPSCSDKTSPPCEPNVTDELDRSLTKWTSWIAGSTPLPTPETTQYASTLGLFEGGRYLMTGMYRPRQNCLMKALGQPFCPICTQSFVLLLYQGGFGVPASGIDPIEPGSENPAPGFVSMPFPGSKTFSVGLLKPTGGNLSTRWLVDGAAVTGATGNTFTYTPTTQGTHRVEVKTKDTTTLVNATMGGNALESGRAWTVGAGQGGRFRIEVDWAVPAQGRSGVGTEVSLTPDTRYFWFFTPSNVELVIKVLDARAVNGKYWVFYGALSSVQYTIRITDTVTQAVKTYTNPSGTLASVADTSAFDGAASPAPGGAPVAGPDEIAWALEAQARAGFASGSPLVSSVAAPPGPAAVCAADATTLCLNGGRFRLRVDWAVPAQGRSGTGKAVPITSDTGDFWFFSEANIELVIKVLDARAVNGHFWVFYGALSSVQYTITVTDMQTGAVKTYQNPSGTLASVADTSAF